MIFRQSIMHKLQEMCVLKIKNCRYIYIYHVESLVIVELCEILVFLSCMQDMDTKCYVYFILYMYTSY